MDMIAGLQNKNHTEDYHFLLLLEKKSEDSDELYAFLDDFLGLLDSKSAYVRTRGFRLACAQAKWDAEDKLNANLDRLLRKLEDDKPTAVRQRLAALRTVVRYKPRLAGRIGETCRAIDLTKYGDSMRPLIEKDIEELENAGRGT